MALFRRLADFLGLRKSIVGMLAMVVLVGMGEHLGEQYLPVYLVALGGGFISVGFLNFLDNLLGALYAFPGGYLSHRLGYKRALLVFNLFSMLGFLVVIVFPSWQAVLVGAVFFLSWSAISLPATMSLVSQVLPKNQRTMGVSVHSLVRRIPMALGPVIGGALIEVWGVEKGVRLAFGGALILAVVAVVLQEALIEDRRESPAGEGAVKNPLRVLAAAGPNLRRLLVADILVRFCEQIPYAFVVLWAMGTPDQPGPVGALQFSALRSVEMATAVLIYIPVAYFADRTHKKPFVVATFVFFTLFPLVLLFSRSFELLLLAFVLRGLKEFGEPTRKALIMDLAPEGAKAQTFGAYYLVRDSIVSIAAFAGGPLWMLSPTANLLTAFAFGALGTLWFAARGRNLA